MTDAVVTVTQQTKGKSRKSGSSSGRFLTYIPRALKAVGPDNNIASNTKYQLDQMMKAICYKIANAARQITIDECKKTIFPKEVEVAVNLFAQPNLAEAVTKKAAEAMETFESHKTAKNESIADRAGLIVPPHLAEKYLRQFGHSNTALNHSTSVYLASVMEGLLREILTQASATTRESKAVIITIRHLYLAINNDADLKALCEHTGIRLLGGGAIPGVRDELLTKSAGGKKKKRGKKKEEQETEEGEATKKHRYRSGTVALRDIRKYQKSGSLLLQKAPFKRLVRQLGRSRSEKLSYTKQFISSVQYYVEDRLVNTCAEALRAMLHAGRKTLYTEDLQFVCGNEVSCSLSVEQLSDIGNAGLNRLSKRAGIKRLREGCYNMLRQIICRELENVLDDTVRMTRYHSAKTVSANMFRRAMALQGVFVTCTEIKNRKKSKKENTENQTENQTKAQTEAVVVQQVPKEPVKPKSASSGTSKGKSASTKHTKTKTAKVSRGGRKEKQATSKPRRTRTVKA